MRLARAPQRSIAAQHSGAMTLRAPRACSRCAAISATATSRVPPGRRRVAVRVREETSTVAASTAQQQEEPRVWLSTKQLERTVELEVLPEGRGQVIVVAKVEPGSEAAQEGVRVGQKLLAVSDPVRDSEVWDMGDRPSLRFVRDTLRMRRMGQVQLVLSGVVPAYRAKVTAPTPAPTPDAGRPSAAGASTGSASAAPDQQQEEAGSAHRSVSALESLLSGGDSDSESIPPSAFASPPPPERLTLGERMAAEYAAKQQALQEVSEVNKRIARRAAYMDEVSQRNDTPLAVGLVVAFLGPALIILGVAASSGYLDRLYDASLTLR